MSFWNTWLRRPQNLWVRKAIFQVHLWAGIALGLYIVVISVSGSAVVYRRELVQALSPKPVLVERTGPRWSPEELKLAAQRAHAGFEITEVYERDNPDQAVEVSLRRGSTQLERLFNPYTGADLGDRLRLGFRLTVWMVDLHDNLLGGQTGRLINGIGAIFVVLLCLTGAVVWWPGVVNWRRSVVGNWRTGAKRVNWSLHSMLGFWCFLFIFMWAISGVYFSFPEPFNTAVEFFEPQDASSRTVSFGEVALMWLSRLHIGRFRGWLQALWVVLGLVPAALFVTGAIMWWNRVLRPVLGFGTQQTRHTAVTQTKPRIAPAAVASAPRRPYSVPRIGSRYKVALASAVVFLAAIVGLARLRGRGESGASDEDNNTRGIVKIAGDLYRAQNGDRYTIFLTTPEGTVVADPISLNFASWLSNELEESTDDEPVRYVVYTGHDGRLVSGGAAFSDTAQFVGHAEMAAALALPRGEVPLPPDSSDLDADKNGRIDRSEARGALQRDFALFDEDGDGALNGAEVRRGPLKDVAPPAITFADQYTITLGGEKVVLIHPGAARSADMTVLYFPSERAVFAGDLLQVKRLPDELQPNVGAWIDALRKIEQIDFDILVPAYGPVGKKEDVSALRRYLQDLAAGVAEGVAKGRTVRELQDSLTLDAYKEWEGYARNRASHIAEAYASLAGSQF